MALVTGGTPAGCHDGRGQRPVLPGRSRIPLSGRQELLVAGGGRCTAFTGFLQDGVFLASGMACGSSDVDNVNFEVAIEPPMKGEVVSYSFFVNRRTLTGEGAILCAPAECGVVFGIPIGSLFSIHAVACRTN